MKNLFCILVVGSILIGSVGIAQAVPIPFTNTVDFSGGGTEVDGRTWIQIGDNSSLFSYPYQHILSGLSPAGVSLVTANLGLTHNGNSANSGEAWFSYTGGSILIGTLGNSSGTTWTTTTWSLGSAILSEMSASNPWTLNVKLVENTTGSDMIKLDKSVLDGTYNPVTPVPEPATLSLLGLGLVGLLGLRKKKV